MMAENVAGHPSKSPVTRRSFGSCLVLVSAMTRGAGSFCVRFVDGLKIRVSAVRFCPWPLSTKRNQRAEIGAFTGSVAARIRFHDCRGMWRDLREVPA